MTSNNRCVNISLDAETEQLLKAAAALSGMSVEKFCLVAIEEKAEKTVFPNGRSPAFTEDTLKKLAESRERIFNGCTLPGNSADFIREARGARMRQLGNCSDS